MSKRSWPSLLTAVLFGTVLCVGSTYAWWSEDAPPAETELIVTESEEVVASEEDAALDDDDDDDGDDGEDRAITVKATGIVVEDRAVEEDRPDSDDDDARRDDDEGDRDDKGDGDRRSDDVINRRKHDKESDDDKPVVKDARPGKSARQSLIRFSDQPSQQPVKKTDEDRHDRRESKENVHHIFGGKDIQGLTVRAVSGDQVPNEEAAKAIQLKFAGGDPQGRIEILADGTALGFNQLQLILIDPTKKEDGQNVLTLKGTPVAELPRGSEAEFLERAIPLLRKALHDQAEHLEKQGHPDQAHKAHQAAEVLERLRPTLKLGETRETQARPVQVHHQDLSRVLYYEAAARAQTEAAMQAGQRSEEAQRAIHRAAEALRKSGQEAAADELLQSIHKLIGAHPHIALHHAPVEVRAAPSLQHVELHSTAPDKSGKIPTRVKVHTEPRADGIGHEGGLALAIVQAEPHEPVSRDMIHGLREDLRGLREEVQSIRKLLERQAPPADEVRKTKTKPAASSGKTPDVRYTNVTNFDVLTRAVITGEPQPKRIGAITAEVFRSLDGKEYIVIRTTPETPYQEVQGLIKLYQEQRPDIQGFLFQGLDEKTPAPPVPSAKPGRAGATATPPVRVIPRTTSGKQPVSITLPAGKTSGKTFKMEYGFERGSGKDSVLEVLQSDDSSFTAPPILSGEKPPTVIEVKPADLKPKATNEPDQKESAPAPAPETPGDVQKF